MTPSSSTVPRMNRTIEPFAEIDFFINFTEKGLDHNVGHLVNLI